MTPKDTVLTGIWRLL